MPDIDIFTVVEAPPEKPRHGSASIVELRDGRLLMHMRTQLGAVFQSDSTDGGATWSKPQTTGLRAPQSMPCQG